MHVYSRPAKKNKKTFTYSFDIAPVNGKRKSITKSGFKTKAEAKAAGIAAEYEYHHGTAIKTKKISYADFSEHWIKNDCEVDCKPVTVANYRKILRIKILPAIGSKYIDEIDKETLQKLLKDLHDNGYSHNSVTEVRGVLSKSFRYALDNKYIRSNPAIALKTPKNAPTNVTVRHIEHVYLESDTMTKIFELFTDKPYYLLSIKLGYECGLRHGEIFGLVWEDIDFEKKTLSVKRQIDWSEDTSRSSEEKKKTNGSKESGNAYLYFKQPKYNSTRVIEISDSLCDYLKKIKETQEAQEAEYDEYYIRMYTEKPITDEYSKHTENKVTTNPTEHEIHPVFRKTNGSIINPRITMHITRLIKESVNQSFTFHSLRHTHTTVLLENELPIKYVSQRLGHKSINITLDTYSHITKKTKDNAQVKINTIFNTPNC